MSTPVTVIARLKVKPGLEAQALAALQHVLEPTRNEPGCLTYDLHQGTADPTEFLFFERWNSQDDLDVHARSSAPHRTTLREALGPLVDGAPSITTWRHVG